jgi:hypothetical protein
MTPTEFLLACIAADEAVARAAVWRSEDPDWDGVDEWEASFASGEMLVGPDKGRLVDTAVVSGPFERGLHMPGSGLDGRRTAVACHIALWDPARALAECEAKRRIVEHCDHDMPPGLAASVLRLLASVYTDRPGFREEWR